MKNSFFESSLYKSLSDAEEVFWVNPDFNTSASADCTLSASDVDDAEKRLRRFAPLIMHYFPETSAAEGIIESPLTEIPEMKKSISHIASCFKGRLFIKQDSELAIAGSVKARGGIYEVLKTAEDIAFKHGLLSSFDDNYLKLASSEARNVFSEYKMQVGSTGNLGLSIGIMSAALGFQAIVHMSSDAKQWKKNLLRSKGVKVIEYSGDYSQAVKSGRELSDADPLSHFVDDENSSDLFLGYATAAKRLKRQLEAQKISVDACHPLFVYIPCGVGGAPGGISFGLKLLFGSNVHCFFAEPTNAPCMLLGLASGLLNNISAGDIGLNGQTAADGLAVGRCSALAAAYMKTMLSGEATVTDEKLGIYLNLLWNSERIFIEPSSCAAFKPLVSLFNNECGYDYIKKQDFQHFMDNSTHIVWATGGSLMPESERSHLIIPIR